MRSFFSPTTTESLPLILFDFFRKLVVLIVAFAAVCRFMFACRGCSALLAQFVYLLYYHNPTRWIAIRFIFFLQALVPRGHSSWLSWSSAIRLAFLVLSIKLKAPRKVFIKLFLIQNADESSLTLKRLKIVFFSKNLEMLQRSFQAWWKEKSSCLDKRSPEIRATKTMKQIIEGIDITINWNITTAWN